MNIGEEYVAMDLNNNFDASHRFWHLNNGHCFVLKYPTGSQGCEDLWIMKDFRDCVLHLCSFSRKSRNHFYTIKMFIQTQNIWGSWSLVGTLCLMECVSVKSLQSTCTLHIWRPTPMPNNIRKNYDDDDKDDYGGGYVEDCRTDNCTHLEKSTELNEKKVTKFRHSFTGIYGFSWIYITISEFFYSPFSWYLFFIFVFSYFCICLLVTGSWPN